MSKALFLDADRHHRPSPTKERAVTVARCLFCPGRFDLGKAAEPGDRTIEDINAHLVTRHRFVIAKIETIVNLGAYLNYWRDKFAKRSLTDYCTVIKTNCGQFDLPETSEDYYLLSPDALPEDKQLREKLSFDRISQVLNDQQAERSSTSFRRRCLFCKTVFEGNRASLLNHMAADHNFSIGLPDNLVYVEEMLDLIDSKLGQKLCLYCEKTFHNWDALKEHMRKKQHKKLNPQNKQYDRFYLINYLEPGRDWASWAEERDDDDGTEPAVDDWVENDASSHMMCLFCHSVEEGLEPLGSHMSSVHQFDLNRLRQWPFLKKIKFVNYVRRCGFQKTCFYCQERFEGEDLVRHLEESGHTSKMPSEEHWDVIEYFFPTYEDDNLLHNLEDEVDDEEELAVVVS